MPWEPETPGKQNRQASWLPRFECQTLKHYSCLSLFSKEEKLLCLLLPESSEAGSAAFRAQDCPQTDSLAVGGFATGLLLATALSFTNSTPTQCHSATPALTARNGLAKCHRRCQLPTIAAASLLWAPTSSPPPTPPTPQQHLNSRRHLD